MGNPGSQWLIPSFSHPLQGQQPSGGRETSEFACCSFQPCPDIQLPGGDEKGRTADGDPISWMSTVFHWRQQWQQRCKALPAVISLQWTMAGQEESISFAMVDEEGCQITGSDA